MHSKLLIAGLLLFGTLSCNSDHPVHENRASGIVAEIHDPASKKSSSLRTAATGATTPKIRFLRFAAPSTGASISWRST